MRLLVDTLRNVVLVPTPAVQSGAPGDYVYLVNADQSVTVHKVTPGPSDGKNTVILSGLAAGQRVVTDDAGPIERRRQNRPYCAEAARQRGRTRRPGARDKTAGREGRAGTSASPAS